MPQIKLQHIISVSSEEKVRCQIGVTVAKPVLSCILGESYLGFCACTSVKMKKKMFTRF